MKKTWFSMAVVILLVGILAFNIGKEFSKEETKPAEQAETKPAVSETTDTVPAASGIAEGEAAPDFELKTLSGESAKLSDYKGQKIILNFWASWCPPCKAEMPHMEEFYEKNKDSKFTILAVNLTNMDRGEDSIKSFVEDYQLTFPILLDEKGEIGAEYQAHAIPTSYVLDEEGIIRNRITGPMSEEMMEDLILNME
ncbi:TlpA family protein disulfide reductase [Metabacillus sp. 113a]|uniref:TlpA family protein disulfide reductase n=1 Tax=Metabacillus sp. 113a TaxID=3404706 RepID=UPI003CF5D3C1